METRKITKIWGNYIVTDEGRVINLRNNREVREVEGKDGYLRVILPLDLGYRKGFNLARLVYEAFNGPIPEGLQIDHINRDKTDNRLCNLRAVTPYLNSHNSVYHREKRDGVYFSKQRGKWIATIGILGKRYYLGIYETEAAADFAHKTALRDWTEDGKIPEGVRHLPPGIKHCSGCDRDLPYSAFYEQPKYKRYTALCKDCHKEDMRRRRAEKKKAESA